MSNRIETSPRQVARLAGISYLALFVLAIFANFFVREGLVDSSDAATTFANIAESEFLFRTGLVSFMIIFILDVAIAWALYVLFKEVNRELSLLSAWFRLVYTVFLGVALIFFFVILQLASGAEFLSAFDPSQIEASALLLANAFNYTWLIGLAAFGIHLILIGYLMVRSGVAPKLLGIVLTVAGSAYVIDTVANALMSNYSEYEGLFLAIVALPSVVGELAFAFWLLMRAGKEQQSSATGDSELVAA